MARRIFISFRQIILTISAVYTQRQWLASGLYIVSGKVAIHLQYRKQFNVLSKSKGARLALIVPIFAIKNGFRRKSAQAFCRANPDSILLFNYQKKKVIRLEPTPRFTMQYFKYREELQKVLHAPTFSISEDRMTLVESWHKGPVLASLPETIRIKYVKQIIEDLIKAISSNSRPIEPFELKKIITDENFKEALNRFEINEKDAINILARIPVVPSHGDLGTHHILIEQESYIVIDWDFELVAKRPAWYDILSFFEMDIKLRQGWVEGEFDKQIRALQSVIGFVDIYIIRVVLPLAWSVSFCSTRPLPHQKIRENKKKVYLERWCDSFDKFGEHYRV
ncbi:MAG: hypothetical protein JJU28_00160 [Cyclobacteriaceae bacterium]|nr:hypothetical protein [Cyclobacteriaceae bacterium]